MKLISSMATRVVLGDLLAAAAADGLPAVDLESVGGVDAAARVAAGEEFDLVLLSAAALDKLAADGHVDAASVTPLVLSQVAAAVPADGSGGAAAPAAGAVAFPDADGLRAALGAATGIGYSTGPSGTALVRMIEEWGMTDEVGDRLVQARPGIPVARLLAEGEVDFGLQQLSELVGQPGVRILGVLPDDCAIDTVFSGAVATASTDPVAARAVLEFLTSDRARAITADHHFAAPPA
ncbi:substrate-binding domain-containing protein [Microbacterium sp.]|uniref:substrate-binding domain-containing protein n=1 Tax=Microbacterium sp. TaxID=51671 RepID=UPI003A8A1DC2